MAKNIKLKIKNAQLANMVEQIAHKKEKRLAPPEENVAEKKTNKPLPKKQQVPIPSKGDRTDREKRDLGKPIPQELPPTPVEKKPISPEKDSPKELKKAGESARLQSPPIFREKMEKSATERPNFSFNTRPAPRRKAHEMLGWKRKKSPFKTQARGKIEAVRPEKLSIRIPISIRELAQSMKLKASELIAKLFMQGISLTINDYLDDETSIQLIGHEFGCDIQIDTREEKRLRITDQSIREEIAKTAPQELTPRPPIVAFMGHVDHGKTSLIDAIRESQIASSEAGAITQHIGAFTCRHKNGAITILDTPGHRAFSTMRQRGTAITDIIILVVAGDEGIMPQTDEAIQYAKGADTPIIVAINKSDKPTFNAEDIYRQLSERDLLPEAWGGMTITVNCSATAKEGIDDLLEILALQAEMLELRANPKARARGTVLEAQLHKGLGATATVLVQNGTLKPGDALVFEESYARVKTMRDERGQPVARATPSTPVEITGLSGIPDPGCEFIAVADKKEAKKLCEARSSGIQKTQPKGEPIDQLLQRQRDAREKKALNLILRTDVQGSLEAIKESLLGLPTKKVSLNFIAEGIGEISESDVELAITANATIVGFHTRVESRAENLAKRSKVPIKLHTLIYHLIDEVKELMAATLEEIREEREMGTLLVKKTFPISRLGTIAGGEVIEGQIKNDHYAKVIREDRVIWEGEIASIKQEKTEVKTVPNGQECGLHLRGFNGAQVGDTIKTFAITHVRQEL